MMWWRRFSRWSSKATGSTAAGGPISRLEPISPSSADAFLGAAAQGHSQFLSALLEPENELGDTALMVAAKDGKGECVKILLRHNPEAQVTATNKEGGTALMLAAEGGHAACVSQLLHHIPEIQVAATNKNGATALILAACRGHADCVSQLLQHIPEAQVLATSREGGTALASAVSNNHPACVALLLAHSPSAQIAAVNGGGHPVVETAARLGHPRCLDLLLAHDPQPQHLDAAWLSALRQWDATRARTGGASPHTQCLERLLAKGALLPISAQEADKAKNRQFIQDFGSRALVADRTNGAIVGLALSVRGNQGKAGQGEGR